MELDGLTYALVRVLIDTSPDSLDSVTTACNLVDRILRRTIDAKTSGNFAEILGHRHADLKKIGGARAHGVMAHVDRAIKELTARSDEIRVGETDMAHCG